MEEILKDNFYHSTFYMNFSKNMSIAVAKTLKNKTDFSCMVPIAKSHVKCIPNYSVSVFMTD